jgi:hypothetical protein
VIASSGSAEMRNLPIDSPSAADMGKLPIDSNSGVAEMRSLPGVHKSSAVVCHPRTFSRTPTTTDPRTDAPAPPACNLGVEEVRVSAKSVVDLWNAANKP